MKFHQSRVQHRPPTPLRHVGIAAAILCATPAALAFQFDTEDPDLTASWNSVVKYSTGFRTTKPIDSQYNRYNYPGYIYSADRNFGDRGKPMTNRADLFSEIDVKYKDVGVRLSGAAWYDAVYMGSNANPGGARQPGDTVPFDEFSDKTKDLHGRKAELLDAFVFGKAQLAEDASGSVRLGRYALQWGESLFFGGNALAGAMSSVDLVKLLSVPNVQFKEAILPVEQISGSLVLGRNWSLDAYYQFKWRPVRLPESGSYFSNLFLANATTGAQVVGPTPFTPVATASGPALTPYEARDSGQFGVGLKFSDVDRGIDYGLYGIKYHPKGIAGVFTSIAPPYGRLLYVEDAEHYAATMAFTHEDVGVGIELGYKRNAPLLSTVPILSFPAPGSPRDPATAGGGQPVNAIGNTAHLNVGVTWTVPRNVLANESMLLAEFAWNRTLKITQNANQLDPNTTRDGSAFQIFWVGNYRQVFPGLDLSVPVGIGYGIDGRASAVGAFAVDHGGNFNFGLNAAYLAKYNFGVTYNHFYGRLGDGGTHPYDQHMKGRDYVSLTASTSF